MGCQWRARWTVRYADRRPRDNTRRGEGAGARKLGEVVGVRSTKRMLGELRRITGALAVPAVQLCLLCQKHS